MKNILTNQVRTASRRYLASISTSRESSSSSCALCSYLARSQYRSSNSTISAYKQQSKPYTHDSHSNSFLDSLESEIETWVKKAPLGKPKDSAPIEKLSHSQNDNVSTSGARSEVQGRNLKRETNTQNNHEEQLEHDPVNNSEGKLDVMAEEKRRQFYSNPDQMPDLPDIAALKPPRLKHYLPGTPRMWYIDQFEAMSRRLMRAFTRPQLEHICGVLGFEQSEEVGLNTPGMERLKALRIQHPSLSVKDLRALVLAEANPRFESSVKKRHPSNASYTKTDLVNFVLTSHWGLTDPKSIPLPINFQALTHRYQTNSETFTMPYHELFLLRLEQTRSPRRNLLSYLARKSHVGVELVQDPAGLMVRGDMKSRDDFWRLYKKMRQPIHQQRIPIPQSIREVAVTPALLASLSELSGCYLEFTSEDQGSLLAYSYHDKPLTDTVNDTFLQLAILSGRHDRTSVAICSFIKNGPNAPPRDFWLCPFLPVSKPSWYNIGVADTYRRFTSPRSKGHFDTINEHGKSQESTRLTSPQLQRIKALHGPMSDLRTWLKDVPTGADQGEIELRATFGHYLYPRQGHGPLIETRFYDNEDQLNLLRAWSSKAIPRPFFLPSVHPLSCNPSINLSSQSQELAKLSTLTDQAIDIDTDEETSVEVFSAPPTETRSSPDSEDWISSLRVTISQDGTVRTEELYQKHVVIMMPDLPMDISFTVTCRNLPKILEGREGYERGLTHFTHNGKRLILTDSYKSQTTKIPIDIEAGKRFSFLNERRMDSRFAAKPLIELRSELSMQHDTPKLDEFIALVNILASHHCGTKSSNRA